MSTSYTPDAAHFFRQSSNPSFENCNFVSGGIGSITSQTASFDPGAVFYTEVAPNAILNAGGRVDPVQCYPGTREKVISQAEMWMAWGYRGDRRIFWLSGPAGAGKSAIVQTLAENGIQRKAVMANFFFFRPDSTRSHSRPVVATLLYQLFELVPGLDVIVNDLIRRDRLVFKKSIRDQFMQLLDGPVRSLRREHPAQPPIVLLIDGLDECDSRPALDDATKSEQRALLDTIHELLTLPDSPFIALVASRAESHIEMAFNRIGCSGCSIFLNEDYLPAMDIRVYLTGELSAIKYTHPLGRYLAPSWPSDSAIHFIAEKSSGQFIYAATIIRFISNSTASPGVTIEMILNIRPAVNKSPFAELDAIYTFILSRCQYWEYARNFLAVDSVMRATENRRYYTPRADSSMVACEQFRHTDQEVSSFFADLKSIICVDVQDRNLRFRHYHASFDDFAFNSSRSGEFFIDVPRICNLLAPDMLLRMSYIWGDMQAEDVLKKVTQCSKSLTKAILYVLAKPPPRGWLDWEEWFPRTIKKLYSKHNNLTWTQMRHGLNKWSVQQPLKRRNPKIVRLQRSDRPELKRKIKHNIRTCWHEHTLNRSLRNCWRSECKAYPKFQAPLKNKRYRTICRIMRGK